MKRIVWGDIEPEARRGSMVLETVLYRPGTVRDE